MVTQAQLDLASDTVFLPLVLLMNFALFQYLVTMFFRRRTETRVRLLLSTALLSFLSLVPFSYPDVDLIHDLNDISETCSVLTFLLQIGILARDVKKKMKLRSLVILAALGDFLVLCGFAVLLCNLVDIVAPVLEMDVVEFFDESFEGTSLVFIFGFRFYFLAMAKGVRRVLTTQKTEIMFYLLFVTHEYPFMVLNHATGLSWEHVQGVWMRITIVLCLWMTIRTKFAGSSFSSKKTTRAGIVSTTTTLHRDSQGPVESSMPSLLKKKASSVQVAVAPMPREYKR